MTVPQVTTATTSASCVRSLHGSGDIEALLITTMALHEAFQTLMAGNGSGTLW
eukprot:CAMPEP_0172812442 /NCGR_PEP_ID=MMETSP1075-20121228/10048_1 /TAXON_ID=2916 /ORGANISM="Ceratium fusus, Strain PA161109" /LENGTH=52 /DNA_ID=CAMNT_0013652005 /DNA_START=64 /DNA_END=219 /DNA_ORIENTATION=+